MNALIRGLLILSCPFLTALAADITIVKPGAAKSALAIGDLVCLPTGAGQTFRETLANDLTRSGWFTVVQSGATLVLAGRLDETAADLRVRVAVRHAGSSREYLDEGFREEQKNARRLAHLVADAIVMAVKGVPGIASTRIVMVGSQGAQKDLYVCDADGGSLTRLTSSGAVCLSPMWWPDGKALAYTSFHRGFPDVYRIDLTTMRRERIVFFAGLNLGGDIAPDGNRMALTLSKDGNPDLYIMHLKSAQVTRLTRTPRAAEASPSWSPDGTQIVYVSDETRRPHLYITDQRTGAQRRITFQGSENVAPDWGLDGRIAYASRREGRFRICVLDPATGKNDVLETDYADYEDPSWAPDGRHLVCSRTERYQSALYILDTGGDSPIRLIDKQGEWYSPAWSPR